MTNRDVISISTLQNPQTASPNRHARGSLSLSPTELSPLPLHSTHSYRQRSTSESRKFAPAVTSQRTPVASVGKSQVYNLTPMTQFQAWSNTSLRGPSLSATAKPNPAAAWAAVQFRQRQRPLVGTEGLLAELRTSTSEFGWTKNGRARWITTADVLSIGLGSECDVVALHPGSKSNARTDTTHLNGIVMIPVICISIVGEGVLQCLSVSLLKFE